LEVVFTLVLKHGVVSGTLLFGGLKSELFATVILLLLIRSLKSTLESKSDVINNTTSSFPGLQLV
jgi:hypothetical protein